MKITTTKAVMDPGHRPGPVTYEFMHAMLYPWRMTSVHAQGGCQQDFKTLDEAIEGADANTSHFMDSNSWHAAAEDVQEQAKNPPEGWKARYAKRLDKREALLQKEAGPGTSPAFGSFQAAKMLTQQFDISAKSAGVMVNFWQRAFRSGLIDAHKFANGALYARAMKVPEFWNSNLQYTMDMLAGDKDVNGRRMDYTWVANLLIGLEHSVDGTLTRAQAWEGIDWYCRRYAPKLRASKGERTPPRDDTRCPLVFRGELCGYKGSAMDCSKTVEACKARSNFTRFGAMPGFPKAQGPSHEVHIHVCATNAEAFAKQLRNNGGKIKPVIQGIVDSLKAAKRLNACEKAAEALTPEYSFASALKEVQGHFKYQPAEMVHAVDHQRIPGTTELLEFKGLRCGRCGAAPRVMLENKAERKLAYRASINCDTCGIVSGTYSGSMNATDALKTAIRGWQEHQAFREDVGVDKAKLEEGHIRGSSMKFEDYVGPFPTTNCRCILESIPGTTIKKPGGWGPGYGDWLDACADPYMKESGLIRKLKEAFSMSEGKAKRFVRYWQQRTWMPDPSILANHDPDWKLEKPVGWSNWFGKHLDSFLKEKGSASVQEFEKALVDEYKMSEEAAAMMVSYWMLKDGPPKLGKFAPVTIAIQKGLNIEARPNLDAHEMGGTIKDHPKVAESPTLTVEIQGRKVNHGAIKEAMEIPENPLFCLKAVAEDIGIILDNNVITHKTVGAARKAMMDKYKFTHHQADMCVDAWLAAAAIPETKEAKQLGRDLTWRDGNWRGLETPQGYGPDHHNHLARRTGKPDKMLAAEMKQKFGLSKRFARRYVRFWRQISG